MGRKEASMDLSQYQVGKSSKAVRVFIWIFMVVWACINLYPLYWMLTFSLKDNLQIWTTNKFGLPDPWVWGNYKEALDSGPIFKYFLNSVLVALFTIVLTLIAALMATYAISRIQWRFSKTVERIFMLGITIPIQASVVPVFVVLNKLEMLDSFQALVIPYAAFALAMAILICSGFMTEIPISLDEAAYIDGCGRAGVFFKVILPLMKPAMATASIYTFLQCWNELMFAQTFNTADKYMTLPVGIMQLTGTHTTNWGAVGAALSIATIPMVIVYVLLSRRIQDSFIAGAIKG